MKILLLCFSLIFATHSSHAALGQCENSPDLSRINKRERELGYTEARLTQWHNVENPNGQILVIHGLNMRPDKMDAVIRELNEAGLNVLNLTLEGHGENYDRFKKVDKNIWVENFKNAYCVLDRESQRNHLPISFFGYSTGATVALNAEIKNPQFKFDKRILMSPAIIMTKMSNLVRMIFSLDFLSLPSSAKNDYMAHKWTPVPAYKALFELADEIVETQKSILNHTETLVIMDKNDELVSYSGIKKFKEERQLNRWSLFTVFTANDTSKTRAPHHAIIHEFFTGPKVWKKLSSRMKNFIKSDT